MLKIGGQTRFEMMFLMEKDKFSAVNSTVMEARGLVVVGSSRSCV